MELLCPRCSLHSRRSRTLVRTLVALCVTSKFFNQIATRHLYHRPTLKKWPMLVRTLMARPDLAGQVKQLLAPDTVQSLHFTSGLHWDSEIHVPSDIEAYYDARLQEYNATALAGTQTPPTDDGTVSPHMNLRSDYIPIVASLCPNLQKLEVEYRENDRPVLTVCKPSSLLHLIKAKVTRKFHNWGCDFQIFRPLVEAAPNVERLVINCLSSCTWWEGMRLEKVTHLDLMESSVGADDLAMLLDACPNLEILEYDCGILWTSEDEYWEHDGGYGEVFTPQFTPVQAGDVILKHAKKLEFFRFNIMQRTNGRDDPDNCWREDKTDILKKAMEKGGIELQLIASWEDYERFE